MMARNAEKYYYPITEAIRSALPLVDEFIVALGEGEPGDLTRELLGSLDSSKIRIFHRSWDESSFTNARILRDETNFALEQCRGDWCLYLQADEVIHERDHPEIMEQCKKFLRDNAVDGFLFRYLHFWGDYRHVLDCHNWYRNDIRIVRNHRGITSYKDAQSFRREGQHLNVIPLKARIFHYGYVRPPVLMQDKRKKQHSLHWGIRSAEQAFSDNPGPFDYGPLGRLRQFGDTHPAVMEERIRQFNWGDQLNYTRKLNLNRPLVKHEKIKYRLLTLLENRLLGGRQLWAYRNWNLLRR